MQYRSEIDGLRALAVVPVILFHAGIGPFGGGYVGVDVFFVISGFLITSILIDELQAGRFDLVHFYERRARRILPALFLVMGVSACAALALMMPSEIDEFAKSVVAATTFWSNVYFWQESGYFSSDAELSPLLHTWSLAVEEQYYLLFPPFLWALWRFGRRVRFGLLGLLFVVSLGLAEWASHAAPSFNFFWLPTRAWELGIGVFAAFILKGRADLGSLRQRQWLSGLGLAMVLGAIFAFDETTRVPGLPALVPTVGAGLIILFATEGTLVRKLLATRLIVGIGLISYSAYLWHQPLFAFARIHVDGEPSTAIMALLTLAVFPLAWASWRFVEAPFRTRARFGRRQIFRFAAIGAIACLSFSSVGQTTRGFEDEIVAVRMSSTEARRYHLIAASLDLDFEAEMADDGICRIWVPTTDALDENRFDACLKRYGAPLVVLGDSHAMNVYNMVADTGIVPFVLGVARGGCRPHAPRPDCHYDAFDAFLERHADDLGPVVYHQAGSYFADVDADEKVDDFVRGDYAFDRAAIASVAAYLDRLHQTHGIDLVWLGPFLEYRQDAFDAVFRESLLSIHPVSRRFFAELETEIRAVLPTIPDIPYVPFETVFTFPESAIVGDCFLYHDTDHFSRCGDQYVAASPAFQVFVRDLVDGGRLESAAKAV